ncbi:MAG: hypothetical protein GX557_10505 [Chloroflexi bacterium]|nr:hypothetical protein [Chloroflexota bacterium]
MSTGLLETRFAPSTQLVRRQLLPAPGEVLVNVGQAVQVNDVLAQAPRAGQLRVIDIAGPLEISVRAVSRHLLVAEGDSVVAGAPLASARWPRLRRRTLNAPCDGTVQAVVDGQVYLRQSVEPYQLRAWLPGQVVEVVPERGVGIAAVGALVRGIWGSGGRRQGPLAVMVAAPNEPLTWDKVGMRYRGALLVGGVLDDPRVLARAVQFRVNGILVGSIAAALRPQCALSPIPIVVTEGLGRVPMARPVFELLLIHHGHEAILSGAADDGQAGPELIVPLLGQSVPASQALVQAHPLTIGALVRLTRSPYLGMVGRVILLPDTPQTTAIGTRALGAQVRLGDGRQVFVPYVNMELLG